MSSSGTAGVRRVRRWLTNDHSVDCLAVALADMDAAARCQVMHPPAIAGPLRKGQRSPLAGWTACHYHGRPPRTGSRAAYAAICALSRRCAISHTMSTTCASNCVPRQRRSSVSASSTLRAWR